MPARILRPTRSKKLQDPLARVLASGALRSVVLYFATHPEEAPSVRALARASGLGLASVQAEIARLVELGILQRRVGDRELNLVLQRRSALWLALVGLVRAAAPVADVLRAALADVPGIEDAFLFGSMVHGAVRPDSDVDLVVVGTPDEHALARRMIDVGVLLGRDVNPIVLDRSEWHARHGSSRPFDRALVMGPKAWIVRGGVVAHDGATERRVTARTRAAAG